MYLVGVIVGVLISKIWFASRERWHLSWLVARLDLQHKKQKKKKKPPKGMESSFIFRNTLLWLAKKQPLRADLWLCLSLTIYLYLVDTLREERTLSSSADLLIIFVCRRFEYLPYEKKVRLLTRMNDGRDLLFGARRGGSRKLHSFARLNAKAAYAWW